MVLRHLPDILCLCDLVTTQNHIGHLKQTRARPKKGCVIVTTNISASSARPVGMGAIIHCSLAKLMSHFPFRSVPSLQNMSVQ